jgi:DNA polymerase-3 subunit delta
MKIQAGKAEGFARNLDAKLVGVLVYGPDTGLVATRAELIAKQITEDLSDPFNVCDLSMEVIKEEPARVADEMTAISFMGGRRLVRVRDGDKSITKAVDSALTLVEGKEDTVFLIITAGDLKPTSTLRQLFEKGKNIAALPCYVEDAMGLANVIRQYTTEKNMRIEREAIQFIAENVQGDRMVVIQELEKLFTYIGDRDEITLEDAMRSVGLTTESSIQDLCNAVASGNLKQVNVHYQKALQQGLMPVVLLRSASNYFLRLYDILGQTQQGKSVDMAVDGLRPPIFFKQKPGLKQHARTWTREHKKLPKALELLRTAELECKKTGADIELMTNRYLMMIATLPRKKA